MNILPISDLHFEHFYDHGAQFIDELNPTNIDVLLICGDIIPVAKFGIQSLIDLALKFPQVVYVAGNHCWWSGHIQETTDILNNLNSKLSNFHYLENEVITIGSQRFLGATLWFDETTTKLADPKNWQDFADFYAIRGGVKTVSDWIFSQNRATIDFLKANMQAKDIVLTHHMPSYKCVAPKFKGSKFNCYFANDLDELILDKKPAFWFAGHSHDSYDFHIGSTRMIANPYGYYGKELNQYFNPNLIIKV